MRYLQGVSKVVLRVSFGPKELTVPSLLLRQRATGLQKDVGVGQQQSRLNGASGSALLAEDDQLAPQQDDDDSDKGGRMASICFPTYRLNGTLSKEVHAQSAGCVVSSQSSVMKKAVPLSRVPHRIEQSTFAW